MGGRVLDQKNLLGTKNTGHTAMERPDIILRVVGWATSCIEHEDERSTLLRTAKEMGRCVFLVLVTV